MNLIFISYASEDRERADRIANALKITIPRVNVWTDKTIPAGQTWATTIGKRINSAACVVVLWSKASSVSEWVRYEARTGLVKNVLVPARIDDVPVPAEFGHIQAADLTEGLETGESFQRFSTQVQQTVGLAKMQAQKETSRLTSLFTTILAGVLLAFSLYHIFNTTIFSSFTKALTLRYENQVPFLLLPVLLFAIIEYWRVLHAEKSDSDIAALYLDVPAFASAFLAADGLRAAMDLAGTAFTSVPAELENYTNLLVRTTSALAAFLLLGLVRYVYGIVLAKTLDAHELRWQLTAQCGGFGLAFAGAFAAKFDKLLFVYVLSWIGIVVMLGYLLMLYITDRRQSVEDRNR